MRTQHNGGGCYWSTLTNSKKLFLIAKSLSVEFMERVVKYFFYQLIANKECPNISTTPLRQCLPFSWTTLRGKHCGHPIVVMAVVNTFRQCPVAQNQSAAIYLPFSWDTSVSVLYLKICFLGRNFFENENQNASPDVISTHCIMQQCDQSQVLTSFKGSRFISSSHVDLDLKENNYLNFWGKKATSACKPF